MGGVNVGQMDAGQAGMMPTVMMPAGQAGNMGQGPQGSMGHGQMDQQGQGMAGIDGNGANGGWQGMPQQSQGMPPQAAPIHNQQADVPPPSTSSATKAFQIVNPHT